MGDNTRVDLGLRVGMLRGHPRMARGFGAPRGRRVVHRDSNPRMVRGFGAPRGRRVGKAVEWPSNTTNNHGYTTVGGITIRHTAKSEKNLIDIVKFLIKRRFRVSAFVPEKGESYT